MKLHGTIIDNLEQALASAKRLRGSHVYGDTVRFWRELLEEAAARRETMAGAELARLDELSERLSAELAARDE